MTTDSLIVRAGRFEFRHHKSITPFEPLYEGQKSSLTDRFGWFYFRYVGTRRDYDIHFMIHNQHFGIKHWFHSKTWDMCWNVVNIKKLHKSTREVGVILGGVWVTFFTEIYTRRRLV